MKKILTIIILPVILLCNCGKKASDPIPPFAANLVSPVQNEVCTQGVVISSTQSTVTLKWNSSLSTDSYEIDVKNLLTGVITTLNTTADTQIDVTLLRNTPYSWYVVSKSNETPATAQSNIWKFYNSGPATVSYAPFPADIVSPTLAQSVTATSGTVTLTWAGSDVDNDIVSYAVYFGTTNTPALLNGNVTTMSLTNVAVTSGTTYYWRVVTTDSKGNTSDSGIFWFKVL